MNCIIMAVMGGGVWVVPWVPEPSGGYGVAGSAIIRLMSQEAVGYIVHEKR